MTEVPHRETAPGPPSPTSLLEDFVARQASRLWHGYHADSSAAVSELARLRQALPRRRFLPPEAWETFDRGFPDRLRGSGDEPSPAELAAATALSLFALHQQSRRESPMHVRGADHTVGRAAHELGRRGEGPGVERRVQALTRSNDLDPLAEHMRALVTQLRAAGIPLDHARLASDLWKAQHPDRLRGVRTRWLRDYYRHRQQDADETTTTEETP